MATMLGQPGQQKEVVFDLDAAAFSGDEFRMYQFKVKRCPRARPHDWTQCPFAHPGEKAKRRDPRRYRYSGTACPEFRRNGCCRRGDACPFAHGVFECWLHPSRYRTQMCTDGSSCKRRVCFFAHTDNELRKPEEDPVWLQQQYQAELAAEQQVQQQIQALKVFTNLLSGSNQTTPQSEALKNIPASQLGSLFPGLGTTQTVGSPPNLGSSSVSAPAGALEEKVKSLGGEAAVMQLLDMLEKSGAAVQSQPVPAPVTSVGSAPQQSLATLLSSLAGGTGEHGLDSQALQAIKAAVPEKTQQQQMMDFLASMLPAVGQQQSGATASEAQSSSAAAQVPPALGNMQDLLRSLGVDLPMNSSPPAPTPPPLTPVHSITSAGAGAGGSNSGAAPSGSANTTTASAADFAAMLSAALGGGKAPVVPPAAPPPPAAASAAPPGQTESLPTPFGVFTNNAAASEAVASAPAAAPAAAAAGPGGAVDMATVMAVLQQTGLLSLLPGAAVAQLQQQQQAAAAARAVAAPAAPSAAGPLGPEAPKSVDPLQAALASLGLGGTAGSGPVAAERSASPEQQQQTAAAAAAAVAAEPSGSWVASSPERPSSDGGASSTGAASSTSPAAVTPSNNTSAGGGPELQAEASSASSVPATGSETSMDAAEAVAGGSGAPAPIGGLALPAELQGSEDGQALLSLFQSLTAKPEMLAHAQLLIDSLTRGAAGKAAAPAEPSA